MVKILTETVPMQDDHCLILVHPKKVCWSPCAQTQDCFCFVGGLRACERSRGKRAVWEGVTHPPILYRFKYSVLDLLSYTLLLILIVWVWASFFFFSFFFLCGGECKGPFVTLTLRWLVSLALLVLVDSLSSGFGYWCLDLVCLVDLGISMKPRVVGRRPTAGEPGTHLLNGRPILSSKSPK